MRIFSFLVGGKMNLHWLTAVLVCSSLVFSWIPLWSFVGFLCYKFPFLSHFLYLKLNKKKKKRKTKQNKIETVGSKMVWLLILLLLNLSFFDLSEARHHRKLPSAVVVGTVFCDTCFQEKFSKTSHFISGSFTTSSVGKLKFV